MKEIIRMWKYSNMSALTAICAGVYMMVLIPFKSIPLIPGFTELRIACVLPVLFGLLFGPAGAWGSAIGNLIADLFGTFGIMSVFGFAANFMYAYIPYKLWCKLCLFRHEDKLPTINSGKKLLEFGIVTLTASTACAVIIAWGSDTLNIITFATSSIIIALNNIVITLILGPVLLPFLYPRIKKIGLLWTDIMNPQDITKPQYPRAYSWLTITGSLGGLLVGMTLCVTLVHQTIFDTRMGIAGSGNLLVSLGVLPFLILMFFSSLKL